MTDKLFTILQKEKTNEAVLSMSLQWYGFMFVSFSWYAPYSFAVSMMFSARNIIKAGLTLHSTYFNSATVSGHGSLSTQKKIIGIPGQSLLGGPKGLLGSPRDS